MVIVIYTTAPEILDGPQTRPIGHAGFTADAIVVRGVSIELGAGVPQIQRYLDAGALVWTENEWLEAAERAEVFPETLDGARREPCTAASKPRGIALVPGRSDDYRR
jgi:hypothetical protein